jgi:hypothetical protein
MQRITFLLVFCALFLFQCKEPVPLEIKPLPYPADAFKISSMIPKDLYKSDGTFQPGYQSGKVLSDRIELEWQQSQRSNFLCYKVYRNDFEQKVISDKTTTTYLDSGLVQDTYYGYRLVNMTKDGMFTSDTIKIKTPRFQRPDQLTYQVLSETIVKLLWNNSSESAGNFDVFRRLASEPDSAAILITTTTDTFYVDNGVIDNGQYFYHVIAYNDFETTEPSDPLFIYINYVMDPPTLLSAQQSPYDRTVMLRWARNSSAEEGFRIYRRSFGGSDRMIAQVPLTDTQYTDSDTILSLRTDSTYIYAMRAYNSREETGLSNERMVIIRQPLFRRISGESTIRDKVALIKNN